jgi:hypothetical protein
MSVTAIREEISQYPDERHSNPSQWQVAWDLPDVGEMAVVAMEMETAAVAIAMAMATAAVAAEKRLVRPGMSPISLAKKSSSSRIKRVRN